MAVKKMVYKHLNSLGFKKYGHNYVKRIGATNCYGMVAVERDRHYTYTDEGKSIETGWCTRVECDKTFYDVRCEVVYVAPDLSQQELTEFFKEADVTYSLNEVSSCDKHKFFKASDEDDERLVSALLKIFYELFYNPVYENKGRCRIAFDDNVSLFSYVKAFYQAGITAEVMFSETLAKMAFDEEKYEEALYYAKITMIICRSSEFDCVCALNNFDKVYADIKRSNGEFMADILNIYETSAKRIYESLIK